LRSRMIGRNMQKYDAWTAAWRITIAHLFCLI
jgi:hypothetical protein